MSQPGGGGGDWYVGAGAGVAPTTVCRQISVHGPVLKGRPRGGNSGGGAGTDLHSRNPRAAATVTAGTGTWTGAARHAGGAGAPWKESGNGLSSLSGTVCVGAGLRHPSHSWAQGRGREALPPPRSHGTAPGVDRCAEPPLPLVKGVQGCL